jgi:hypothetical protein
MIRTQIQLEESQARKLRAHARLRGISVAELIRRCVEKALVDEDADRAALYERAAAIIGRFPDKRGAQDLSRRHDKYLAEAFE